MPKQLPHDPALKRTLEVISKEIHPLSKEVRLAFLSDLVGELQTLLDDELDQS
jgi:hypothetical protein